MQFAKEKIQEISKKYPIVAKDLYVHYGTAGFRTKALYLYHVMFRMGILAVLRSIFKEGASIGIMITASHNPEEDNGIKLVDPGGEMLASDWEQIATDVANAEETSLMDVLEDLMKKFSITLVGQGSVIFGQDTRESSPALSMAAIDGVKAVGGRCIDYGVLATPQLHYFVVCQNSKCSDGDTSENGYYRKLINSFIKIWNVGNGATRTNLNNYKSEIHFDGANGVGAIKLKQLMDFDDKLSKLLFVNIHNNGPSENLNRNCGADFVKLKQTFPCGIPMDIIDDEITCVSVDGDADRIIYFFRNKSKQFQLLDGDRIAVLVATYIKELLDCNDVRLNSPISIGVVQTAYANGSSTKYIKEHLNIPVVCVPTGVKYLHKRAQDDFDIGIYFEANGHGTVLFSAFAQRIIGNLSSRAMTAVKLQSLLSLANQFVGDALADFLLIESILHDKGWSLLDWIRLYDDLPNRQIRVCVADRNLISTCDAERKCVTPLGLQEAIDLLVLATNDAQSRAFVRPSGTEDVVRVYAEASIQTTADRLAYQVGMEVYKQANGVGSPPLHQN